MNILLALFSFTYALLAWRKMNWALVILIAFLPTYLIRFQVFGVPMTFLELMILVVFSVWLCKSIINKEWKQIIYSQYKWLIVFFVLSAVAGVYASPDKLAALGIFKAYFVEPVLLFIVVINQIKNQNNFFNLINGLGWGSLLVALPAIIQKFTGWGIINPFWLAEETRRVTSWYGFPNAIGLFLGPLSVLFFGLILYSFLAKKNFSVWRKLFYALVFLLNCSAIYFAGSEGALLAVVASCIMLLFCWPQRKIKLVALLVVLLLGGTLSLNSDLRENFRDKVTLQDLSGQIRLQMWSETWQMLNQNKLLQGAGLSGYQEAVAPYHQEGIFFNKHKDPDFHRKTVFNAEYRQEVWQPVEIYMYPHNIFLNFWTEIGLAGLLVFVFIVGRFFLLYFKIPVERKTIYLILLAMMVEIFIHGLVDVPYFKNDLSVLFWLLIALSVIVSRKKFALKK